MGTKEQIKSVEVAGRLWRDSNGNTYHTATAYVDGKPVAQVPMGYGYGNSYEWNAAKLLEEAGLMPGREHYKNGGAEPAWRYFQDRGIEYRSEAQDVRKKDL